MFLNAWTRDICSLDIIASTGEMVETQSVGINTAPPVANRIPGNNQKKADTTWTLNGLSGLLTSSPKLGMRTIATVTPQRTEMKHSTPT